MTGSASRQVMRHRCTTERNAAAADDWGAQGPSTWQPHLTGQPCHVFYTAGRLQQTPGQTEPISELRMLLPVGADVIDGDRVSQVLDRLGASLFDGPLVIQGPIARRADHLVLALREAG